MLAGGGPAHIMMERGGGGVREEDESEGMRTGLKG